MYRLFLGCILTAALCAGAGWPSTNGRTRAAPAPPQGRVAVLPFTARNEIAPECAEAAWSAATQVLREQRFAVPMREELIAAARAVQVDLQAYDAWKAADYERLCEALNVRGVIRGTLTTRTEIEHEPVTRALGDDYQPSESEAVRYVRAEAHLVVVGDRWTGSPEARYTDRERVGSEADAGSLPRKTYIACRDAARHASRKLLASRGDLSGR